MCSPFYCIINGGYSGPEALILPFDNRNFDISYNGNPQWINNLIDDVAS